MNQACLDNGVHTLLAVKGTSHRLIAGSEDDHICNHRSMSGGVYACCIKFLLHSSGGIL